MGSSILWDLIPSKHSGPNNPDYLSIHQTTEDHSYKTQNRYIPSGDPVVHYSILFDLGGQLLGIIFLYTGLYPA